MAGIFDLATRHADWLAQRRVVVANNIANANTPGYQTREAQPFQSMLEQRSLALARSHGTHLAAEVPPEPGLAETVADLDQFHSGNTVTLDNEMMKMGDVARSHTLNVSIVRAFHRMYLNSVRG